MKLKKAEKISRKIQAKTCRTCYGYGIYPIGRPTPIGPMDAKEWKGHIKKCPECKVGDVDWEGSK